MAAADDLSRKRLYRHHRTDNRRRPVNRNPRSRDSLSERGVIREQQHRAGILKDAGDPCEALLDQLVIIHTDTKA